MKSHIARALGVMMLLFGLLTVAGSALMPAASAAEVAPSCRNYKGSYSLSASNPNPAPGETITITGAGFTTTPAGGTMSVTVFVNGSTLVGTATTKSDGSFALTWTVPSTAAVNTKYTFTADCGSNPVTPTIVTVSAVTATTSVPGGTGNLPSTGSSSTMPLLASGVAMVVLGGLILLATRKRTQRAGQAA